MFQCSWLDTGQQQRHYAVAVLLALPFDFKRLAYLSTDPGRVDGMWTQYDDDLAGGCDSFAYFWRQLITAT